MAKADMKLSDGTKVTIEGTPDEVAALIARLSPVQSGPVRPGKRGARRPRRSESARAKSPSESTRSTAKGPADYIRELVGEDFFKTKRALADVRLKLEERAHIYPNTSLSPVLFRLVRNKELRRLKEDGKWRYVNV